MAETAIQIPYISSHYALPESTLTTLRQAPTVELVNQLLQSINKKAHESDELKSDKLRLEVELENSVRSNESKVKVLKASVEKGHAEVAELRKKLHEADTTRASLETEISALKSSSTSNESETTSLKARISSLEASNRDTLGLLESKSAAYDKLAEELSLQHKKTIELRRELSTAEQNLQSANAASASARFREQSLQQELDLTKKNNEWFETELKTKSAEYIKFRKEKGARISELQRENEEANSTIDSLRRSENSLKSRLDETEQRYETSLASIHQLKEEAIQATESFRIELDSSNRLAELQGSAAQTAKQRVQECQLALEKTKDDAAQEISRLRVELETESNDKGAAERRIGELEALVAQLESEPVRGRSASPAVSLNGGAPSTPLRTSVMRAGTPTGSFSPRASRGKSGMNVTQMYSEYDRMRTALAAEQRTCQELRNTVDEMVLELDSTRPEIEEGRAEQARLDHAVVEMSTLLEAAGKERDAALKEARKWQGQVEGLAREGDILRQQLRDLSAEVKVLVLEVAVAKHGEEYDREELERIARGEVEDSSKDLNETGRFISKHLTTFKDLHELQDQNHTLRRMLRELGDKQEGEEAQAKEATRRAEIDELKELRIRAQTNRDEIANLSAQMQSYVKERDTFRSMLMHRKPTVDDQSVFSQSMPLGAAPQGAMETSGPDYAELLRKVQAHFDTFREETTTDHKALRQQVNELSRKNSELMSDISRSSSQLAAASQRAELLQSNFNMLKNENSEIQKRYSALFENANRQDLRTQQAAEDLVEAKGLVESLQRENANLKAEKDLWKNIEKRLIDDTENLRNERSRLDSLNANLQTILNEREHTDSESRRRLQASVESLETELQSTKRKLNDEVEESKKASMRREYEQETSQKRIDDLVTSLSAVREELVAAKTTRDHLQSRVDELAVELKSAEERLQVLNLRSSVSAGTTEGLAEGQESGEGSGLSREQELSIEVSELKRDLELAKGELEHAKQLAEDYQAISQASEERLESATETQEQYREETDRLVEEKNVKIHDLETRIEEISAELSASNTEMTKLREEQAEATRHLEEQKANFESEITRLKADNERYVTAAQYHQEDLNAQAEIAKHAQQNYEAELVKHAEAAKNLQVVRAESNQLKLDIAELRTQSEGYKTDLCQKEESWAEQRATYEGELSELRKRREEVLHQNSVLHTQLENITSQISSLQRDRMNVSDDEQEGEQAAPNLEGLQEVIKFLRREKEIVEVQYHLSTQESKRLNQQLDYTQSQLDETRLKLEQQRRAAADSDHNALNHSKLLETINELNVFRESNATLRNQLKQTEAVRDQKIARENELVQEIEPLKTRIHELESQIEAKDGEMQLLQADRDRYQQRIQNILQKYDRVDPTEMQELKEKLASLETENTKAASDREALQTQVDALQAQIAEFPEQLKQHSDERAQDLRSKLTEQFKARSKDLSARVKAKQDELNVVLQEKEVIQAELQTTKSELEALKTKGVETPANVTYAPVAAAATAVEEAPTNATPASQFPNATVEILSPAEAQKIQALEQKIQRLEAALAEKDGLLATQASEQDAKIKERADRLKDMYNSKLNEVKAAHRQEIEKLSAGERSIPGTPGAGPDATPATPSKTIELAGFAIPELTDAQARELVAKHETIRTIVRNNIRGGVAREQQKLQQEAQASSGANEAALAELQQKSAEEREALVKAHENEVKEKVSSAVELVEKKTAARLSMLDTRFRTANAKIDVVSKAATETPQKPVVEVWEIAKTARPAPVAVPAAKPPVPAPIPVQPIATAPTLAAPQVPATAPSVPVPAPAPTPASIPVVATPNVPTEQVASLTATPEAAAPQQGEAQLAAPANPFGQVQQTDQNKQASSLPSKPPAGNPPGLMRALQSGLPIARGGRGGRGGGQQFGHQQHEQQQQQGHVQGQTQRGPGVQRGRGGRGGQGRGGTQNQNNVAQAQSPTANRGNLNASARQFIPGGNKRSRDDGPDTAPDGGSGGKRQRGGGGPQPRGGGSS
ncbi:Filament-forming protein (Tpr/p270), putative [Penicillium digitatum PHI26]|uniref:Filament-forming protein (Tpr/p270), putative n=1 Tax=Penicillium digitatum (strain PHI26 / CECT 20796) TaxID=1170229 RepID=K9FG91_PEND2|nr:Filament-forming protein (Tpr/p270), putative [Penicillium digitatum PHI26]